MFNLYPYNDTYNNNNCSVVRNNLCTQDMEQNDSSFRKGFTT